MKRSLLFIINGEANIDLEDVVFFGSDGKSVDTSNMSTEEIQDKLLNYELEWDWLILVSNPGFNVRVEELNIVEGEP